MGVVVMKGINSRAKGANYERKVVNIFKEELGLMKSDCFRTPMSGGHMAVSQFLPGDVQFRPDLAEALKISIECKYHNTAKLEHLFRVNADDYWSKWLEQAERDAAKARFDPVLVARVGRVDLAITRIPFNAHRESCLTFKRGSKTYQATKLDCFLRFIRDRMPESMPGPKRKRSRKAKQR